MNKPELQIEDIDNLMIQFSIIPDIYGYLKPLRLETIDGIGYITARAGAKLVGIHVRQLLESILEHEDLFVSVIKKDDDFIGDEYSYASPLLIYRDGTQAVIDC